MARFKNIYEMLEAFPADKKIEGINWELIYSKISALKNEDALQTLSVQHRVHFLKRAWFRYAAAILLLIIGATTYYILSTSQSQQKLTQVQPLPSQKGRCFTWL